MRIYLIRHPRPAVATGICYGRSDLPLAENAAHCATRLVPLLPPSAPVYSSPLIRCRQLAKLLHPAPNYDDRLREMDFGAWEMQAWESIGREALDAWAAAPLDFVPPGGESVAAMRVRVNAFIAERKADACPELVLVSHAGVMKTLVAELTGVPASLWLSAQFDYGTVSLIEEGRVAWYNRVAT
ncbi:MAG: alpha-ribazole phosphatase family protein [Georgfuchsia sp.]